MENVDLIYAKDHLEELITRAARGEDVRIADPKLGTVKLTPVVDRHDAARRSPRKPGILKGVIPPPPDGFFDPMTEEELKDWYGDDA